MLTLETYESKLNHYYDVYTKASGNKEESYYWDVILCDAAAIADREHYTANPVGVNPEKHESYRWMLSNLGLLPDPIFASKGILDRIKKLWTQLVLFIRSYIGGSKKEANQLRQTYSQIKFEANARYYCAISQQMWAIPRFLFEVQVERGELDWRLYSLGAAKETQAVIIDCSLMIHQLKPQQNIGAREYANLWFKEGFIQELQMPLRELMFSRQKLCQEIVEAAESYPLLSSAKPLHLPSLAEHSSALEKVVAIVKKYRKTGHLR
jgi:hypothetical protein